MNILLIDADSTIPNLALMKLSAYHKNKGDNVELKQLHLPYYPNRKKSVISIDTSEYDKTYCSIVFDVNNRFIIGDNIVFGGTGVSLNVALPKKVELYEPDYSIYPDNDISYGFMTRGCIRNCSFCKVPKKEGHIHLVHEPEDIIRHKKVKFMDNNILAYKDHKRLLSKILEINPRLQFNQGLDIRLIDSENSYLLSKLKYIDNIYFAFDDIKYVDIIENKLKILDWRKDFRISFFVYVHPNMPLSDTVRRIEWLKDHKCFPYIMRDISCWDSQHSKFYIDLAGWCNQMKIFKKMSFDEFLYKKHVERCPVRPDPARVANHWQLYCENI